MCWMYPFTRGKTVSVRCFLFQHSVLANPTVFWTLLRSNAYEFVTDFVLFLSGKKLRYRLSTHMLIFVVKIRPSRKFWNSTHCLLSPFTLDWSRNLWNNPMWNMAVNNISYLIYPLSTRTEKGYITKMIPFFFVQYMLNVRSTFCFVGWRWRRLNIASQERNVSIIEM